jgi:hypothetical protein
MCPAGQPGVLTLIVAFHNFCLKTTHLGVLKGNVRVPYITFYNY